MGRIYCGFCNRDITEEYHYLVPDDCCKDCYAKMKLKDKPKLKEVA